MGSKAGSRTGSRRGSRRLPAMSEGGVVLVQGERTDVPDGWVWPLLMGRQLAALRGLLRRIAPPMQRARAWKRRRESAWCAGGVHVVGYTSARARAAAMAAHRAASLWKAGWRKMIAAKPIITGVHTMVLMRPYMMLLRTVCMGVSVGVG